MNIENLLRLKFGLDLEEVHSDINVALHNRKKTVLLVDDDPESLLLEKHALSHTGLNIVEAKNIPEAMRFLRYGTPDLVITDIGFFNKDSGYGLMSYIQRSKHLCAVPVFVVSAKGDEASIDKAFTLGALEYFVKPFKTGPLLKKMSSYL